MNQMMRIGVGDPRGSQKPIRIVVVGENGTGKSSLIMAASDASFHPKIPPLLPHTNLPSELFSDPIPVTIIDTSSRPKDKGEVVKQVKEADAIILTFAFDRPESYSRLSEYWLPLFRQLEVRVPIIVAGHRADIKRDHNQSSIEQIRTHMMQQFREIETSFDWSAQDVNHARWLARDVIKHAQQAVIHPLRPIYDQETNSLKPFCVAALKRVFILSCHNSDFVLNDADLNDIQVKCFNKQLMPYQSKAIRKTVQVRCPFGVNEIGLTWVGFLFLNTYLVEQGRIKTVWTILRKFGYNNDLRLADSMIPYSSFKREADQSVQLTYAAIEFLKEVYEFFDQDEDDNLEPHEMGYIFQTAPESPWKEAPYKDAVEKSKIGGLSFQAFLSLWSLMTLIDPARSLEYLIYIRYPYDPSSAILVTRKRELDRKEQTSRRKVVQCFVFGPKNAGKSALLNRLIGRPYDDANRNGSAEERYAVNMVDNSGEIAYTKRTLVMKEIRYPEDGFLLSSEALASCDVAIFVYDSSDESSWKGAIDLLAEVATFSKDEGFEFPCLMVAAKADLYPFPMEFQESTRVTQEIGIEAPIPVSSKLGDVDYLFLKIIAAAVHPHLCIPKIESKKKRSWELINRSLMAVSIGTAALVIGMASFRLYAGRKHS
ncbi:unnamed protein product [Thlaspi arvense]|uniref:Mitochondrial Rho GTPase n=1 Tax=Thlaspi arvense TaxID=13288 RepID=A0AAU9S6M7_THLAR|nr:unnamed protein product [Thlaspi arvense]